MKGTSAETPTAAASRAHQGSRSARAYERREPAAADAGALLRAGDPLVDADLRALGGSLDFAHRAHTFWMSAFPSRPLGRTSSRTIRIEKTKTSWNVEET